jgi:hypothetical protein
MQLRTMADWHRWEEFQAGDKASREGVRRGPRGAVDQAMRTKTPPPEHTIPADAPGIHDLVCALLSIWPEFEWERLVLNPGPEYNHLRQSTLAPQVPDPKTNGNVGEFA